MNSIFNAFEIPTSVRIDDFQIFRVIILTVETSNKIFESNPYLDHNDNLFLHLTLLAIEPEKFDQQIFCDKKLSKENMYLTKMYFICIAQKAMDKRSS